MRETAPARGRAGARARLFGTTASFQRPHRAADSRCGPRAGIWTRTKMSTGCGARTVFLPLLEGSASSKLHFPQSLVIIIELNASSSHGRVSELVADAVVLFSQVTRSASRASTRSPSSFSTRLRCAAWPTLRARRRRRARSLQPRWVSCVDQGDKEESRDTASCGNTACCAQPIVSWPGCCCPALTCAGCASPLPQLGIEGGPLRGGPPETRERWERVRRAPHEPWMVNGSMDPESFLDIFRQVPARPAT